MALLSAQDVGSAPELTQSLASIYPNTSKGWGRAQLIWLLDFALQLLSYGGVFQAIGALDRSSRYGCAAYP